METTEVVFYTRESLAAEAGISVRTISDHIRRNCLGLQSAREVVPGMGMLFHASKVRRYLAGVRALKGHK